MDGTDIKEVVKVWTSRTARKQRRQQLLRRHRGQGLGV
jgi:hypothetical protein